MSIVNVIVEGDLDAAVAVRIIAETGHETGFVYGRRGIGFIREKLTAFNRSARHISYLAMVDPMDTRLSCPPEVLAAWLPSPNRGMLFRIVVREIESWLMADREGIAALLSIPVSRVPIDTETVSNPKQFLVNLARRRRKRRIKDSFVPAVGSTAQNGRLYVSELSAFAQGGWNITRAASGSRSLGRCLDRLRAFVLP